MYDEYSKLKHLQEEFIEDRVCLADGVVETMYSNGESVVVNYNECPFLLNSGETVPFRGFKLIKTIKK